MAIKMMAGIGALLIVLGVLLTGITMSVTEIGWNDIAELLVDSAPHLELRELEDAPHGHFSIQFDNGRLLRFRFGNHVLTID